MTNDQLFYKYKNLAKIVGGYLFKKISSYSSLEYNDIIQIGYLAIIECIEEKVDTFKFFSENELENYLKIRINGSILDALRKEDLISKERRKEGKELLIQYNELCQILKRKPYNYEFMHYLEISDLDKYYEKINLMFTLPIVNFLSDIRNDNIENIIDDIIFNSQDSTICHSKENVRQKIDHQNIKNYIIDLLKFSDNNSKQDKIIKMCLNLFYLQDMKGKDIAKKINFSESMFWNYMKEGNIWLKNKIKNKYGEVITI